MSRETNDLAGLQPFPTRQCQVKYRDRREAASLSDNGNGFPGGAVVSETLGGFEKLLLLAILRLGDEAYGAAIVEELEKRTARSVSQGAVYVTLRRLTDRGLLRSGHGESTAQRGGRPKRYYRLRPEALEALREARDEWNAMLAGVETLLESDA